MDLKQSTKRDLNNFHLIRGNPELIGQHIDWMYCPERLSNADCQAIIDSCLTFPLSPCDTVGSDMLPDHRQGFPRKIGINDETKWIFDLLCNVAAQASNTGSGLKLTTIARAPQYVEYRPGRGQFDWHNDYSHGLTIAPRKLTIIIQLARPEEYEGGNLEIFGPKIETLPRERGTIIAFPSFLYHRVTPVIKGERRVLVSWISGPRII